MSGTTIDALRDVPLFADLDGDELARVASVFKERRFADGEEFVCGCERLRLPASGADQQLDPTHTKVSINTSVQHTRSSVMV